jgi:hypothetical protein
MALTADRARMLLAYNAETGALTWKTKTNRSIRLGSQAGVVHNGRITVGIDKKMYPIGRVIWLIVRGHLPNGVIDHINGNPLDNRLCNLRDVSQRVNVENLQGPRSHNKSGLLGVCWHAGNNAWRATIVVKGRQKTIGYYDNPITAHEAYILEKRLLHTGNTL